ncbi:putative ribonuclease H-like domain-containing protein [Tanacetum coccineum]|uniref:Ribonuclease H-like domain-containing protein n=1 Tax=Tanacetum coccineum TaxID=301880 RepID=A0ABQ5IJR4_9ASTR
MGYQGYSSTKAAMIEDALKGQWCAIDGAGFDGVDKDWKEKFFYPANHVESVNKIEKPVRKNNDAPIIEDWVSDDEDEVETTVVVKGTKTVIPTAAKIEKPVRKPVRYAEMYRSQRPRETKGTGKEFESHFNIACLQTRQEKRLYSRSYESRTIFQKIQIAVMPIWKDALYFGDAAPKIVVMLKYKIKIGFLSAISEGRLITGSKVIEQLVQKWVTEQEKDERGIVIKNKARLVAQGHTQEECIDYDEVFAPVARIEAIRMFLAYASYMGSLWVYQMDVKGPFLVWSIEEEGICMSPSRFGKPVVQDGELIDVDDIYIDAIIGSLMYICSLSRPDIMFAVVPCARFQVSPKNLSHLLAVKRIFRYLKGKPSLGLWYSKDSPLELVAYTDSDYAGATQDRKSTTGGCQFLGNRLISWQCKKQTVVATSTTEAEYVAAASCCGQVLWIQNQLLDYGYNFMNIVIYIDNNSTICIIENPVQHSKTKHIEIRHHFIRDCNAKKLIQMAKIDTEHNVADLLTKGFDAGRFQYLVLRSEGFHQVIDFLSQSHICYALTKKPEIYISFIKQFWRTAEASTDTDGEVTITVIIDGHSKTITEASLRRHLKLEDHDGITSIPNSEIFQQLVLIGYQTDSDKLTFSEGCFLTSMEVSYTYSTSLS